MPEDLVTMYHPLNPGDEAVLVPRATYRAVWYAKGWRSDDDAGFTGLADIPSYDPGTIIAIAHKSDANFLTTSITSVAVPGLAISFVMPAQPVTVQARARIKAETAGERTSMNLFLDSDLVHDLGGIAMVADAANASDMRIMQGELPDPFHQTEPGDLVTVRAYLKTSVATSDAELFAQDAGIFGKFVATIKATAG